MSAFSNAVLALSPSSYWRFDSGSPLADSGSGGQTLTAVGSPSQAASLVPGEAAAANSAYDLNGTSQYLQAGDVYEFTGEIDWTLAYWIRSDDTTGFRRILEKRDTVSPNAGWYVYQSGGGNVTLDVDFGATVEGMTDGPVMPAATAVWIVITWVDSTNTMSLYQNGSLFGTETSWTTAPGFPASSTSLFTIGASSSGTSPMDGVIDDVAVWSGTALSSTQIGNLWTAANTSIEKQAFYGYRRRMVGGRR